MSTYGVRYVFEVDTASAVSGGKAVEDALGGADKAAEELDGSLGDAGKATEKLSIATVAFGNIAADAFRSAVSAISQFVSGSTEASARNEQAIIRIQSLVRQTGMAAGFTATELVGMADAMELTSTFDADSIMEAQAKLLTFKSVAGDAFTSAMRAAVDLAATGFGSVEGNAIQLGKALENPKIGMGALTRVGVTFTEQQKERIELLQEEGDLYGAQMIILRAIEGQAGGTAAALAQTPSGQWQQFVNIQGALEDKLGSVINTVKVQLIPAFEVLFEVGHDAVNVIAEGASWIITNWDKITPMLKGVAAAIGLAGAAWAAYAIRANAAAIATAAATGGLTIIIGAIAALAGILFTSKDALDGFKEMLAGIGDLAVEFFTNLPRVAVASMRLLAEAVALPFEMLSGFFTGLFDGLLGNFTAFVQAIYQVVTGDFAGAWETMKGIGTSTMESVKDGVVESFSGIETAIAGFASAADWGPGMERVKSGGAALGAAFAEAFNFEAGRVRFGPGGADTGAGDIGAPAQSLPDSTALDNYLAETGAAWDDWFTMTDSGAKAFYEGMTYYEDQLFAHYKMLDGERRKLNDARIADEQSMMDAITEVRDVDVMLAESMMALNVSSAKSFEDMGKSALASAGEVLFSYVRMSVGAAMFSAMKTVPFPANLAVAASVGALVEGAARVAVGALTKGFEAGGLVTGAGPQTIRVNEAGPEYVVNAEATKRYLPLLESINAGGRIAAVRPGGADVPDPSGMMAGMTGPGPQNIRVEVADIVLDGEQLRILLSRATQYNADMVGV